MKTRFERRRPEGWFRTAVVLLAGSALALASIAACSSSSAGESGGDASAADGSGGDELTSAAEGGAGALVVGAPCLPSPELTAGFNGFTVETVTVDDGNAACGGGVCLVDHFQGRVSCPFGEDPKGDPLSGSMRCTVPGTSTPIMSSDPVVLQAVNPQCVDRRATSTVSCSCRCANAAGTTDDGDAYCTCPSGFTCSPVVPLLVDGDKRAGSYCIRQGSAYDSTNACGAVCDPKTCPDEVDAGVAPGGGQATTYSATILSTKPGLCYPTALPVDSAGKAMCQVLEILATGDTCASHAGLTAVSPAVASGIFGGEDAGQRAVCLLNELAPTPCASSATPGWCYLSGANAAKGCIQNIDFAMGSIAAGAAVALACP